MAGKKGPSKGTGGHGRRKLSGKGPTPKAEDRPGHPAARRAKSAAKRAAAAQPASARSAASRRTPRGPQPDEVVAGRNPVVEALRAGIPAVALYLATGLERDQRVDEIRKLAGDAEVPVMEASRGELDRLAGGAVHQGVALAARPFEYLHPDDLLRRAQEASSAPLIIALDGVTDPHNLGAIARSAAAFGADGLVVPERRSVGVTASAWKASAGTLARIPVAKAGNLVRTLTSYAEAGLMIAGLDGRGEIDLDGLELATGPLVLVVGAEGRGLSRLVGERCDLTVRIPLAGSVESLNASVAAGVALAEIARRRRLS
ncbi:MAG: 23S rRNA (guanosine(2251)-2'-O)-methyltransferase RlmB [Frankiaceae bacterium]|nr:23S rRNA (guanosine(2251)-2'-O)-methyltransferase RlmB [Frankiaceae bacterium]MBV9368501.1 23S rRNA (guanosine(2251)-2'-O)-methyltransferase RlmB [Frankiales bacterium]